ncbi:MAG: trigger factor [Clostridia bacterium]|nr:trigger factor [Clostridia bacterium]
MYKLLKKEKNTLIYEVTASNQEFETFVNKAYEETKGKYSVQGFRKGKVPRKVIEQNYGKDIFMEDGLMGLINHNYQLILTENKDVQPVGRPEVEVESANENGVKLRILIPVMPEVKLGAYTGLEIKKANAKVTAKAVNDEIAQIQNRQARFVAVERAAQNGDFVVIDFVGRAGGKEFEGGKAEDYRLELGSNTFIPGFEDQIVGQNIGEKRTIKVKFPEDYFSAELKGKDAEFDVTLNKVEEKQLPELNDEFASNVSEFNTFEEFKADIKKHLAESVKNQNKQKDENSLIEAIVKNTEVEIPASMVESQIDKQVEDFRQRIAYQGATLESYLELTRSSMEELRNVNRPSAENAVKTQLVIGEIIKKEKITVSQEEIDAKLQEIATKYQKSLEEYKKLVGEYELSYIANDIIITKLFDFLFKNNNLI